MTGKLNIKNPWLTFIHGFFFLLFGLLSLLNHYYFRSAGLDYGLANQALYQYAHGNAAYTSVLLGEAPMNYLAVHLSLWVVFLSPFYFLFGSYTLLLLQNAALVFGAVGLVKTARMHGLSDRSIHSVVLSYYLFFGWYAALAFDYHDNVMAACFVPWLFYYWARERKAGIILCFLAILLSKENMSIWMLFLLPGLWWVHGKKQTPLFMVLWLASAIWFLLAGMVIMPALNPNGKFEQLSRYSYMGKDLGSIVTYILTHPLHMIELFFRSHIQPDAEEVVKQEFLMALLFSGGLFLLLRPAFLVMALPLLMQKLWNKELAFWGVSFHYQAEFAPVVALALVWFLKSKTNLRQYLISFVTAILTLTTTLYFWHSRKAAFDPVKENLISKSHYQPAFDPTVVSGKLNLIPPETKVCAQSNLLPHLMAHECLYHFPFVRDADAVLFLEPQLNSYPLSAEDARLFIDSLRTSGYWKEDSASRPLHLLTRVTPLP